MQRTILGIVLIILGAAAIVWALGGALGTGQQFAVVVGVLLLVDGMRRYLAGDVPAGGGTAGGRVVPKSDFPLGGLPDQDLDWLRANGRVVDVAAGTTLIREGEQVDSIYIALQGTLAFIGPDMPLHRIRPGDLAGDLSFVQPAPALLSFRAETPSRVLEISHASLRARCEADPAFASRVFQMFARYSALRSRFTHSGGFEPVEPGAGTARALERLLAPAA